MIPWDAAIERWVAWTTVADDREPVFLEAMNHHEHNLNYPGVDIINRTNPQR